jgi:hypothetical protein
VLAQVGGSGPGADEHVGFTARSIAGDLRSVTEVSSTSMWVSGESVASAATIWARRLRCRGAAGG